MSTKYCMNGKYTCNNMHDHVTRSELPQVPYPLCLHQVLPSLFERIGNHIGIMLIPLWIWFLIDLAN